MFRVKLIRQVSVFAIVGALATLCHAVTAMLVVYVSGNAVLANLLGFLFAQPVSYFGHTKYSFCGDFSSRGLIRFLLVNSWLWLVSIMSSWVLTLYSINSYANVFLVIFLLTIVSFLAHKFITFRSPSVR